MALGVRASNTPITCSNFSPLITLICQYRAMVPVLGVGYAFLGRLTISVPTASRGRRISRCTLSAPSR